MPESPSQPGMLWSRDDRGQWYRLRVAWVDVAEGLRTEQSIRIRPVLIVGLVGAMALAAVVNPLVAHTLSRGILRPSALPGIVIVVVAIVAGIWRRSTEAARRRKKEYLEQQLCPACGYSIAEIRREDDGCRVCPECGAAWRAP